MQSIPLPRQAIVLSAFAALCVAGVSGCRNSAVDDVPPLNRTDTAPEPVTASTDAKTDAELAAGDAAANAIETKAAAKPAAPPAPAPAPAPAVPAAPDAKIDAELAAADLAAKKIEDDAAESLALAAKNAAGHRGDGVNAPAVAAQLAGRLVASGALQASARTGRIVVQVNRAINETLVPVDRSAITAAVEDAVTAGNPAVVTTGMLHGESQTEKVKAIHMAFDTESKALGIIPSHSLSDAPDIFVNTVVSNDDDGERVTVTVISSDTGKTLGSESKPL